MRATHHFLSEKDIQLLKPQIATNYLPAMSHVTGLVGIRERIVGFLGARGQHVEMLFVEPCCHGCGAGKALLRYAIEHWHVNSLDVNEQNPQAVGFYQHMGFEVVGRSAYDQQGNPFPLLHMRYARAC